MSTQTSASPDINSNLRFHKKKSSTKHTARSLRHADPTNLDSSSSPNQTQSTSGNVQVLSKTTLHDVHFTSPIPQGNASHQTISTQLILMDESAAAKSQLELILVKLS